MKAFFFFLVRRWSRALPGRAAAAAVLVFPFVLVAVTALLALFQSSWNVGRFRESLAQLPNSWCWGLLFSLLFAVVNLLAFAVDDERHSGRSRLLRVGGLDGLAPVGAFLFFGAAIALVFPLGAALPAWLLGALLGVASPMTWLSSAVASAFVALQIVPLAVAAAFFLPRSAALLGVNVAALILPFLPLFRTTNGGAPFVADLRAVVIATLVNVAASLALARAWRRQSARFWS